MWEEEKYCDITLITNKKNKIKAHRLVLSSFSKYFQALLGPNFGDGKQEEIEIPVPDESILNALINFAYSGRVDISTENVQDLLDGASYLDVEFVVKACSDFLKSAIDDKVCFGILQLADRYGLQELRQTAKNHVLRNFVTLSCENEEFLDLPTNLFIELIQDEGICVVIEGIVPSVEKREQAVLQAVLHYTKHDLPNRKEKLAKFLSHVRLALISPSYLEEVRATCTEPAMSGCAAVIDKAISDREILVSHPMDDVNAENKLTKPRQFAECQVWEGRGYARDRFIYPEIYDFNDDGIAQDDDDMFIKGMKMWIRRWDGRPVLGGIEVYYSNDKSVMHGGSTAEEQYEFHLGDNERIVKVEVQSGWMIDRLTFYSNKFENGQAKKYGPYGGPGGGEYSETPPGSFGFLSWIKGSVVETQGSLGITRLKFKWKTYFFPGDDANSDEDEDEDSSSYAYSSGLESE